MDVDVDDLDLHLFQERSLAGLELGSDGRGGER
jgi:hypothetical protein